MILFNTYSDSDKSQIKYTSYQHAGNLFRSRDFHATYYTASRGSVIVVDKCSSHISYLFYNVYLFNKFKENGNQNRKLTKILSRIRVQQNFEVGGGNPETW